MIKDMIPYWQNALSRFVASRKAPYLMMFAYNRNKTPAWNNHCLGAKNFRRGFFYPNYGRKVGGERF